MGVGRLVSTKNCSFSGSMFVYQRVPLWNSWNMSTRCRLLVASSSLEMLSWRQKPIPLCQFYVQLDVGAIDMHDIAMYIYIIFDMYYIKLYYYILLYHIRLHYIIFFILLILYHMILKLYGIKRYSTILHYIILYYILYITYMYIYTYCTIFSDQRWQHNFGLLFLNQGPPETGVEVWFDFLMGIEPYWTRQKAGFNFPWKVHHLSGYLWKACFPLKTGLAPPG